jgi:hypothetical protein
MDSQWRENFFSIFAPTLGGYKYHFNDLKWGAKIENKNFSLLTVPLTDKGGKMS